MNELDKACTDTINRLRGTNRPEPVYVYVLMEEIIKVLNGPIAQRLRSSGILLRSSGVFIHNRPKVQFRSGRGTTRRELGDLLIVTEHGGRPVSALMYQVKKDIQRLPNDDQFLLYNELPNFSYTNWYKGQGKERHISGGVQSCAQYLAIDTQTRPHFVSLWATIDNQRGPLCGATLASEILHLMACMSGRSCRSNDEGDWGTVVRDLLSSNSEATLHAAKGLASGINPYTGKASRVIGCFGGITAQQPLAHLLVKYYFPTLPESMLHSYISESLADSMPNHVGIGSDNIGPWNDGDEGDGQGISTLLVSFDSDQP